MATNPIELSKRFNPSKGANGEDENFREMSPKFFLELSLAAGERRGVCSAYLNSLLIPVDVRALGWREAGAAEGLSGTDQKLPIDQGEVREKNEQKEDPACGKVEARDGIRKSPVAENHEGGDPRRVSEKHGSRSSEVGDQRASLGQTIPIQQHDEASQAPPG